MAKEIDVLVMGTGHAGLAVGDYFQQKNANFLIVDASSRVGVVWRKLH